MGRNFHLIIDADPCKFIIHTSMCIKLWTVGGTAPEFRPELHVHMMLRYNVIYKLKYDVSNCATALSDKA